MYYIYGVSVPSLLIESTDSMIITSKIMIRSILCNIIGTNIIETKKSYLCHLSVLQISSYIIISHCYQYQTRLKCIYEQLLAHVLIT